MTILVVGLLLFLGVHAIALVNEPWRDRMVARMGELTWKGLYSTVALAGLLLIIHGYGAARYDPLVLYTPPAGLRHLSFLLLLPVFPLLLATYLPGRIRSTVGHPMVLAVKLWAAAHLLVNGTLADVLLFGGLLAWGVAERISFKHRVPRTLPAEAPAGRWNDAIALVAGLAIYVVFALWLHPLLIGVPVI